MLVAKLRNLLPSLTSVAAGLLAIAVVTMLGPTRAFARHAHGDHDAGWSGGGGSGGNGGGDWTSSWGQGDDEDDAQFDLTSFSGRYTASDQAFDATPSGTNPATPLAVSGTIASDGNGNITGGALQIDFGTPGTGSDSICSETGTYTVTPDGQMMLNLVSSCTNVTCTLVSGAPSCTPSGSPMVTPTQWFCSLSGPGGKHAVCTEMGEAVGSSALTTPISTLTWNRGQSASSGDGD